MALLPLCLKTSKQLSHLSLCEKSAHNKICLIFSVKYTFAKRLRTFSNAVRFSRLYWVRIKHRIAWHNSTITQKAIINCPFPTHCHLSSPFSFDAFCSCIHWSWYISWNGSWIIFNQIRLVSKRENSKIRKVLFGPLSK